jgi:putative membrane protein
VRVHLAGPAAPAADAYPEDTWLRVEGRIVPLPPDSAVDFVPELTVSDVTRIDPPENPYAY